MDEDVSDRLLVEIDGPIAVVTLNRPDKYNGMDMPMMQAWRDVPKKLAKNRNIRAVILRGSGKAFCAGLDFATITSSKKQAAQVVKSFLKPGRTNDFQQACWAWRDLPVPVFAVIHGYCFGAGMQLAMAADFRYATPDCQFSIMESKWGIVPDMTGTVTWREVLPLDVAKELAMTGRQFDSAEAKDLQLLTGVSVEPEALARSLIDQILTRSPDCVSATKVLFNKNWGNSESAALANERKIQAKLLRGKNQRRAVKANMSKKAPRFAPRQFSG